MKSKLHIFVALFGWIIFIAYVFYDYHEHGSDTLRHFFTPNDISETAFHLIILFSPLGSSTIAYLINERKKLFTKAQQSEEKYRTMIENSNDLIWTLDKKGNFTYFNKKAEEVSGYKLTEWLGKSFAPLIPQDDLHRIKEIFIETINGNPKHYDVDIYRKDGTLFSLSVNTAPIFKSDKIIETVSFGHDITTRKQSEQEHKTILKTAFDGFWINDKEGRFLDVNDSYCQMIGYPRKELLTMSITDVEVIEKPEETIKHIKKIIEQGSDRFETRHKSKDGKIIDLEVSVNYIRERERLYVFLRDITERKQIEEVIQLQLKRLGVLRSIEKAITASLDLRVTLDVLLDQITTNFGVDAAALLLLNQHSQILEYVVSKGFRSSALKYTRLKLGESNAGRAAIERQILTIPNLKKEPGGFISSKLFNQEDFVTYCVVPLIAKGEVKGVLELFYRSRVDCDPEWLEFLETIADQAAIAIDNATLFEKLQSSNVELTLAYDTTIEGWSHAMDMRDKETEGHTQRVTEMTLRIAQEMGIKEEEFVHIRRGALLHDMGKLGVPDNILLKPGPLTDEEWVIMKRHPQLAYEMLYQIEYLRPALDIPYCHHERWDGTGYPQGLKGEEIPLAARIFAVVDVWDALNSDRPYRPAWTKEKVREHICSLSGTHFEPNVAEVFLKMEW